MKHFIEKYFQLNKKKTSVRQECGAAFVTFLSMVYIIFVNPTILNIAGIPKEPLITSTILIIIVGCLMIGLIAKLPVAMAPGMGLNAFFSYNLVLANHLTWQEGLGVVVISGCLFFILSLVGFQKTIMQNLPNSLKAGVGAGIGFFITFIGFINMGIVGKNATTFVQFNSLSPTSIMSIIGLFVMIVLLLLNVKSFILFGIIVTTVLALCTGFLHFPSHVISMPPSIAPIFMHLSFPAVITASVVSSIFSLMFVNLCDAMISMNVITDLLKFDDEKEKIKTFNKAMQVDPLNTAFAGVMGSSPTTAFIESLTGIAAGGKTGLTALFLALFFVFALFFSPIIALVPSYAVAPAFIMVGLMMTKSLTRIDLTNPKEAIPAYLTAIIMPLTYSIGYGLIFGFLSAIIVEIVSGKIRDIHWILWLMGIFSLIELALI